AGRVGRRLPAVGLGLGHARGDDPLAVGWYRLGLLVRGRPRGRAHRGGHANGRDQLEGIPSRRVVHRSISSRSTNEIQNNRRLQRIESVTWSGPTGRLIRFTNTNVSHRCNATGWGRLGRRSCHCKRARCGSECARGFGNLSGKLIRYCSAPKHLGNVKHIAKWLILATACPSDAPTSRAADRTVEGCQLTPPPVATFDTPRPEHPAGDAKDAGDLGDLAPPRMCPAAPQTSPDPH